MRTLEVFVFDDDVFAVDCYGVGFDVYFGVYQAAAGCDFEGPLVPGAVQDFAVAVDGNGGTVGGGWGAGCDPAGEFAGAEGPFLWGQMLRRA